MTKLEFNAGRLSRDLLGEIVNGGPKSTIDDDGVNPLAGKLESFQRRCSIVADSSPLAYLEANVAEALADVAEIGIDRGAG